MPKIALILLCMLLSGCTLLLERKVDYRDIKPFIIDDGRILL